jgi:DNA primase
MPRIPEEEIGRLKSETDLKTLVESYGVKLEARGKDFFGLCPFHDDHEPSLVVTPEKHLWNCLGACRSGGTVIDWVMKMEKASFRHAVEILKTKFGVRGSEFGAATAREVTPSLQLSTPNLSSDLDKQEQIQSSAYPGGSDWTVPDRGLLNQVIGYYQATLKDSPEALAYLENRKLNHPELIDHFKLGYGNRTLGYRLPDKQLKSGIEIRGKLQEIGILRESGHEHFNGSLVIPVFDENNQVTEIYGRKIRDDLRKGTPLHLYLPGQHKGVFNIQVLAASKEIILCEALIDALTFWCHGFRNVTASYGVNGFTADHLAAFKQYGVEQVLIAYDNDEAGNSAAKALTERLEGEGLACARIVFPLNMDANAFAQKSGNPQKDFEKLIASTRLQVPGSGLQGQPIFPSAPDTDHIREAANVPTPVINNDEIIITLGERRWRARGLDKNMSYEQLKVNLLVSSGERFFVDTLDLYSARLRQMFIKQAAAELEITEDIVKHDLGKVLLNLEELQDAQIKKTLEPKKAEVVLTEQERAAALAFLQDPKLLERILSDFEKCGVTGEEINKLMGYLAAVSRKLDNPLAVIIQSSSAAGKTWLMDSILAMMPEEERVKYSAMTGQSLFYLGESDLKHKILAIVEEEGAERASYALKLLQSEGELSIASTGKDPQTGKMLTHEYRVEGPVMIFITTTGIDIDEELQNRCLVLTVNESREQTKAIHQLQRERRTLSGLQSKLKRAAVLKLHRNAQRLLRPLKVVNPYALRLTFLDDRTRTRRDHDKYLNLIDTIALLHQYQRPVKQLNVSGGGQEYIEVAMSDIETANKLAGEVLGRSLDDLPPQTRRCMELIYKMVLMECQKLAVDQSDYRFSRRQLRDHCNWSLTQVRVHLDRLIEQEYVLVHRGGRGQSFVYELLYNGEGIKGELFLAGLIDVKQLKKPQYDCNLAEFGGQVAAKSDELAGAKRPQNGAKTGGWRGDKISQDTNKIAALNPLAAVFVEKTHIGVCIKSRSHSRINAEFQWPVFSSVLEFYCFYSILAAKVKEFEQEKSPRQGIAQPPRQESNALPIELGRS